MSAIAGIFFADGKPVQTETLASMLAALSHRGPDHVHSWIGGAIGLGNRLLRTTPESQYEAMPAQNASGNLVITADVRLDNRRELIAALLITGHAASEIPDSQLILAAYEKWGTQCPEKLLGDFAFAIWDAQKRILFCARDHFGMRPFYYYRHSNLFVFASEIKGLLAMPEVPRRVNEARVLEYLASYTENVEHTFYEGIFKLPPAHSMVVAGNQISFQRYWSLEPSYELRLSSDAAYADAFREIFLEAVASRTRTITPLGSTLSGGLDSSSIACAAAQILRSRQDAPLHTFSVIFDDVPQSDERAYMQAALGIGGMVPHTIHGDHIGPISDLDQMLNDQDEPFHGPNLFLHRAMYQAAKSAGVGVLLDGLDGDTTVSHGIIRLTELARTLHWLSLVHEARGLGNNFGASTGSVLKNYALYPLMPPVLKSAWSSVRRKPSPADALRGALNPDFLKKTDFENRVSELYEFGNNSFLSERASHHHRLTRGLLSHVLEITDHASSAYSLEVRYPFFDRRLIEFCLSVPSDQKLRHGWSRWIMREAMAGILPKEIQWRGDKANLEHNFLHTLVAFDFKRLEEILSHDEQIGAYVNLPLVRDKLKLLSLQKTWNNAELVLKTATLALWLRRLL